MPIGFLIMPSSGLTKNKALAMRAFYCVYICERIITRLEWFSGDELDLGLATVYLGFLGTVVGAFIRAAMDIAARYK